MKLLLILFIISSFLFFVIILKQLFKNNNKKINKKKKNDKIYVTKKEYAITMFNKFKRCDLISENSDFRYYKENVDRLNIDDILHYEIGNFIYDKKHLVWVYNNKILPTYVASILSEYERGLLYDRN